MVLRFIGVLIYLLCVVISFWGIGNVTKRKKRLPILTTIPQNILMYLSFAGVFCTAIFLIKLPFLGGFLTCLLALTSYAVGMRLVVIGLTGGIACGKSTVSELLQQNGFYIIDAD